MNTTRRTLNARALLILVSLAITPLPAPAETVIVESRTTNTASTITADPPYAELSAGTWFNSSAKSSASDTTSSRPGSRYADRGTPSVRITPTLVPGATYTMEVSQTTVNASPNLLVNITYSGCTGSASSSTAFNSAAGSVSSWENIGTITVDPGVTQPSITFTYASGTLASTAGRWYVDALRFVNQGDPCVTALSELATNAGPLEAGQTFVDVPNVNAAAIAVTVYADGVSIGEKNSGVTAGLNRVTTSPLVKGQVITATQRNASGVDSCRPSTGGIVGGGNPRVRMSLSVRQTPTLTGPIGANGGVGSSIIKFIAATNILGGGAPLGGKVIYPSNEWQTVTFLRGPDPANPTDRTYRWNGTDTTHDLLGDFGVLDGIAFAIDDLTDTGPWHLFIDTLQNGDTVIQDFDAFANGAITVQFNAPSFSGTTSGFLFAPGNVSPNVSRVTDQTSDTGGKSAEVQWQFKDTQNVNWLRLVAQGTGTPNPQLDLRQPISFRLRMLPPGVSLPPSPPVITTQPADTTVVESGNVTLRVVAGGTGPLSYQWSESGVPIPDATASTLTLSNVALSAPRTFSVEVSNSVATVNSSNAVLTVQPAPFSLVMTQCWRLPPGSRPYITTDNTQRGLAYNAPYNHVLLVSRSPSNAIHVLDANTGDYLHSMDLTGVSGGTLAINMVACTPDGQVFAGNLTQNGSTADFKLYGWFDSLPGSAAVLAWSGNPGSDTNLFPGVETNRWGDSLDVRGTGGGVEAIVGSRADRKVAILGNLFLPTSDPAVVVDVPDADPGNFGLSVQWGDGDTCWGKSSGTAIRYVSFDRNTHLGALLRTIPGYSTMTVMNVDAANQLIAGVVLENPDTLRLLDIGPLHPGGHVVDTEFFGADNANGNGTGSVRFGGGKVFALDSNNGLLALRIGGRLNHSLSGTMLTLTWDGARTLQSAPDLSQDFTDVMGATSPYTVDTAVMGNLFYRLRE